jgi:hypothetical protein
MQGVPSRASSTLTERPKRRDRALGTDGQGIPAQGCSQRVRPPTVTTTEVECESAKDFGKKQGLAIQHFAARGGDLVQLVYLVYLVSLICFVFLDQGTR